MRRYYITDRARLPGSARLYQTGGRRDGVDLIQIREKDLNARDLLALAQSRSAAVSLGRLGVLVNGRADIALAAEAHGVHLPSHRSHPAPSGAAFCRRIFSLACHATLTAEIREAEGADLIVYGPVLRVPGRVRGVGLDALRIAASSTRSLIFALGGITAETRHPVFDAGAVGIAAIRLFQKTIRSYSQNVLSKKIS